jgi:transcriptional regulator with XRE-family HTH domain
MDESFENESIGSRIAKARLALKLSQLELAGALGVSQATISRLESSDEYPKDIRLLAKVARELEIPIAEVFPQGLFEGTDAAPFFVFCPNPLCGGNDRTMRDGSPTLSYKAAKHSAREFDKANYCKLCGTELVKDCPACGRRFTDGISKFCETCGQKIFPEILEDQWEQIRKLAAPHDDDIPF